MTDDDVKTALARMRESAILARLDPENPACRECGIHAERLYDGRCPECADDLLQAETGCRFGEPGCDHDACSS